jgi:hypothetical protein
LGFNLYLLFASVRYVLLALVPTVLLLQRAFQGPWRSRPSWWLATVGSFALAIVLSVSDLQLAGLYRGYVQKLPPAAQQRWFTGHWGLQYYMEKAGAKPVSSSSLPKPGDEVITFLMPFPQDVPPATRLELIERTEIPSHLWLRTLTRAGTACFYANGLADRGLPLYVWLPFGISGEPQEVLTRWKVVAPTR